MITRTEARKIRLNEEAIKAAKHQQAIEAADIAQRQLLYNREYANSISISDGE